mmetsp:Transcript_24745/g.79932  ORF Transcript_24745/g.79932 Transcript_24745/m.79932 type:complete len:364 (+) Transcript_24745:755-1846(+)
MGHSAGGGAAPPRPRGGGGGGGGTVAPLPAGSFSATCAGDAAAASNSSSSSNEGSSMTAADALPSLPPHREAAYSSAAATIGSNGTVVLALGGGSSAVESSYMGGAAAGARSFLKTLGAPICNRDALAKRSRSCCRDSRFALPGSSPSSSSSSTSLGLLGACAGTAVTPAAAAAAAADAPCGGARGENWRRVVHSSCHSRNPVPISHPTMWGSAHCTGNGPSSFDLWFCSCQLQSVSHTAALPGGVPGGQWIFRTSESTFDCDQKRASRYSSYPGLTRSDGICTMYCSPAGLVRSTRISRVPPLSRSSVVVMWSSHGPHSSRSSVLVAARLIFQCVATEPSPSIVYRHTNGSGRVVVPSGSFS